MPTKALLLIILAFIIALGIAVFQYFVLKKQKRKINILLAFLRFLSVFGILLLLINPKIKNQVVEVEKPILTLLVDNSISIKNNDGDNKVLAALNDIKLNRGIVAKFDLKRYQFGNQLVTLDSLSFSDNQTNISSPINQLNKIYNKNNAPIILITDGNENIGTSYEFINSKQPVYPLIVGDTIQYQDLKIASINVNKYSYLENKFPVEVLVNYDGKNSVKSNLVIYKGKTIVFKKLLDFSKEKTSNLIDFYLNADKVGVTNYSAVITPLQNEKNKLNNRKRFSVDVIDQQSKILILSSFLHPDLGALKKSIESNKQRKVDLKLISNSNINYSDYQLIMIYQPNNKFKSIFDRLNSDNSNYFVITGSKTDWKFLNENQNIFSKNHITTIENYTPLLNEGFTLFNNKDLGFENFPPLEDSFGKLTFKTPSNILLYQKSPLGTKSEPLLALLNDGSVKTGALFGENIWRWRMYSYQEKQSFEPFDNYMGSIINYLTSTKKSGRLEIDYKNNYYQNESITVTAHFYDENYQLNSKAQLFIKVFDENKKEVVNQPFNLKNNFFQANITGLESGNYTFKVAVKGDAKIVKYGNFYVEDYNSEALFINPAIDKLQLLATNSNGQIYYINQTNSLINDLINNPNYTAIQKSKTTFQSLIDWKWLLGFILLFLTAEWFIRKYYGYI